MGPPPVRLETRPHETRRENGESMCASLHKKDTNWLNIFRYFAGEYPKSGL
jgi:hypothetical protein